MYKVASCWTIIDTNLFIDVYLFMDYLTIHSVVKPIHRQITGQLVNNELKMTCNEVIMTQLAVLYRHLTEGLRKTPNLRAEI